MQGFDRLPIRYVDGPRGDPMDIDTPDGVFVNPNSKPKGLGEPEPLDAVHDFALGYLERIL